jgi:hypothetical protein
MRGFLRFIFGLIFVISAFSAVFLFSLKTTIFTYENIKTRLTKYNVYEILYEAVPEITNMVVGKGETASKEDAALTGIQIGSVITNSISADYLEQKITMFLSGTYDWLYGDGPVIPEISFLDIKPKLENFAAIQMGVPIEFIRSGMSGFSVPEKIQIQPVAALLIARKVLSGYDFYMMVLISCAIASLAAIIVTGNDGLAGFIKMPIRPFWVTGVITSLFGGVIWLFFNAGNLLSKLVAEQLGSAPKAMALTYDLINGLLVDFVKILLIFSAVLIVLAIILEIWVKLLKKKDTDKFQENLAKK